MCVRELKNINIMNIVNLSHFINNILCFLVMFVEQLQTIIKEMFIDSFHIPRTGYGFSLLIYFGVSYGVDSSAYFKV